MPGPGNAQSAEPAVQNVAPGGAGIDLTVGQGRLVHFDGPVDSVFLADPTIADVKVVAADVVYVYAKRTGMTNLIAKSEDQKVRASVQFRVVTNAQPVNDAMHRLQPTTMTEISILGERVAATGKTRKIEEAIDAQNAVDTFSPPSQPPINNTTIEGSQQVNIRVRFAEVSRTELQSLGFDWKVFGGAGASTVGTLGGKVDIEVLIEALRRSGVLNILAEPNLTAVSGQTANFLAGGEIPIPIAEPGGVMQVTYKQFGVSLDFTPTIIATDRIALHVRPQVSAVVQLGDFKVGNVTLPTFTVRRADTTVEVASGETFAIAGLLQRQMTQELDKLPGLGDLPVLGAVFSSERFRRNETELVILITPYLVKPTQGRRLTTPLDRPAPPAALPPPIPEASNAGPVSSGLIMK
ncbi:MAG: type II and III secretion system protein family protein [Alphaproteobacteria bacterium]|nr:type II and III secretion system protein family protein [Alphaproteobacteria bacterium]